MNIVIIEGLDNTGKSTIINSLQAKYNDKRTHIIHCEKPKGNTNEEMAQYQNQFFLKLTQNLINFKKNDIYDLVILDRAWYGEYVYGQLYRKHDPFDIEMNISSIEDSLKYFFDENELSLILLNVNNIDFSISHDDGLSISEANRDKMLLEQSMFETIFNYSTIINKANIIVNNGLKFKSKEEIFDKVCKMIKIVK